MSTGRGSLDLPYLPILLSIPLARASSPSGASRVKAWQAIFRKRGWLVLPTGSVSYTDDTLPTLILCDSRFRALSRLASRLPMFEPNPKYTVTSSVTNCPPPYNRVAHLADKYRLLDIVNPHHISAVSNADGYGSQASFKTLVRRQIQYLANH